MAPDARTRVAVGLLALAGCVGPAPAPGPAVQDVARAEGVVLMSVPDAAGQAWVESTLAGLSLEAQVGQLIVEWIPGGYVPPTSPHFEPLRRWVVQEGIGGVSPSIGTPHAYAAKLNALQEIAAVPLLVASDFENGGPGMRINGSFALPSMLPQGGGTDFPPTMAFGAIGDERFAFEYGRITAREARASGVHLLFSPVMDVNSNPDNPVIATRSFGEDPDLVARLGSAFIRGAHAGGALATAKHFPGHGDTSSDSHTGIPVVDADRARLDSVEFVPFVAAIDAGVDAVMTAHVQLPRLLGPLAPPATLSASILTGVLRDDLGFDGLILTDAMTMRGITDMYGVAEASVRSLEAGADIVLSPRAVEPVRAAILQAVHEGRLSQDRIRASARRMLELKARLGLHRERFVSLDAVDDVVGSGAHVAFADSAATRSITLVRDEAGQVPWDATSVDRTVHIVYGPSSRLWANLTFSVGLGSRVLDLQELRLDERTDSAQWAVAAAAVRDADRVLLSAYVHPSAGSGVDALPEPLRDLLAEPTASGRPPAVISFGSPYIVAALPHETSLMLAWGDRTLPQDAALAALFGEEAITGRLPVSLPPEFAVGDGLDRPKVVSREAVVVADDPLVAAGITAGAAGAFGRDQSVAEPESVGMSSAALSRVDSILIAAIADSATPGAAIAVGRHGRLVWLKGLGELHYGTRRPVTPTSLYDLASLTKVVGTTSAIMSLADEGALDLDAPVVRYLPWWSGGQPAKEAVTVRQLLVHRAGLPPFRRWFLELEGREAFQAAVAAELLEYEAGSRTVYSDIGFMTLGWIAEAVTGSTLDAVLEERVWRPLGMRETGFRPSATARARIAPTEVDDDWRERLVWGTVHDENSAAMGGVSGHAGLFGTAVDLSVFARTLLAGGAAPACVPGEVAGEPCPVRRRSPVHLFESETVQLFTTRFDDTASRALGWDTPSGLSSAGDFMTERAFGHTGFTGTSIWMDPELDLWVVLLTNRVHPTRENSAHVPLRRAVHDAVVQAIVDRAVEPRTSR